MGAEPTAHRGKLNIEEEGKLKRSVVKGNWNMVRSLISHDRNAYPQHPYRAMHTRTP